MEPLVPGPPDPARLSCEPGDEDVVDVEEGEAETGRVQAGEDSEANVNGP